VRYRLFWESYRRNCDPPYLPKVPLVKWSKGLRFQASTHRIEDVRCAPSTGVLLHFKLFSDFIDRAKTEAERGEHWRGAQEYAAYAESLAAKPDMDPMYEGSVRFENTSQLVKLGLMIDASPAFAAG
jgi:hypothetical protein